MLDSDKNIKRLAILEGLKSKLRHLASSALTRSVSEPVGDHSLGGGDSYSSLDGYNGNDSLPSVVEPNNHFPGPLSRQHLQRSVSTPVVTSPRHPQQQNRTRMSQPQSAMLAETQINDMLSTLDVGSDEITNSGELVLKQLADSASGDMVVPEEV